ncbi:hypothetical protein LBMAG42_03070 [Deltaproteobacteria bacterium]|nr:hypothetical protein LBMAG42_03070 [Deltaproteobacteria bacterium]
MSPDLRPGARLFAAGHFFEAHEVWEADWKTLPMGPERRAIQGLIHLAVALEHRRRGSLRSAAGQWAKAKDKLVNGCPGVPFDLTAVLLAVAPCLDAAERGEMADIPSLSRYNPA